ncbi:MAG: helix-turn-helix transcriptional regulator [Sideroxyarcus sp.]|nr:helix-turn-helix transcriptional regulator [Sideroxyarcus sp.]
MSNLTSVLKEEITRLSRKETRSETDKLRKASTLYRSEIAALKRRTAALEQQISRLEKLLPQKVREQEEPEAKSSARFTAKGFKTLRKRLGLTAEATAALLGVSAQTIYNWEAGNSSPREQQMVRIVMLRGMGKKEVGAILQNLAG